MTNKIAFIGGGNMTRAIVAGLLGSGTDAASLSISEPLEAARDQLGTDFPGVMIRGDNRMVASEATCLVLAVKPQILADVCRELEDVVQDTRPLIVSIAAGVRGADIESWLGGNLAVIRVMPNQPALLGLGVSGVYANERASAADRDRADEIMSAVGSVVEVGSEADIDAVTAVSGSGPAYFFLFIDQLAATAVELGIEPAAATQLAKETAAGAAELATQSDDSMAELIARVRSPGGTTAAALDSLEGADVRGIFAAAITAARDRAVELADEAHRT